VEEKRRRQLRKKFDFALQEAKPVRRFLFVSPSAADAMAVKT